MKKYITVIGLPSGEYMTLTIPITKILLNKGLVWKEAIFDGEKNVVHYVYADSLTENIYDELSAVDPDLW